MALGQDVKRMWVDALRSGRFVQGKGTLFHSGRHCCLGVLAEVVGRLEGRCVVGEYRGQKIHCYDHLPMGFMREIGLSASSHGFLTVMNDSGEATFEEIADFIEEAL